MAYLNIDGKDYYAKTNFKFERVANEKYSTQQDGEDLGGFMSIYLRLLQFDNEAIVQFWDCALSHYKKNKPTVEQIEDALEDRIEADGDTDGVLKEAFQSLDQSGFYKKQVNNIWNELTNVPKASKNETAEEAKARKEQEQATEAMSKRREQLS